MGKYPNTRKYFLSSIPHPFGSELLKKIFTRIKLHDALNDGRKW